MKNAFHHIYIDNYFTSVCLLRELSLGGIYCTGTIRRNRVEGAPLIDLRKANRGVHDALQQTTAKGTFVILVRWQDNSEVTVATNRDDALVLNQTTTTRWSKADGQRVQVPQPTIIAEYDAGMGGVDLFDQMHGQYRTHIRCKRWYWPLVIFNRDRSLVNEWMLYRRRGHNIPYLDFQRAVVQVLLAAPSIERPKGVRPKTSAQVIDEIHLDCKEHWPALNPTQR